jgi:hypothetical protein
MCPPWCALPYAQVWWTRKSAERGRECRAFRLTAFSRIPHRQAPPRCLKWPARDEARCPTGAASSNTGAPLLDSTHACGNTDDAIFVIIAARSSRRDSLRTLIASIEPRCLVEVAPSTTDIALLPLGSPVNLLVLDLEFETRESLALIPLLAKRRPATAIIALYNVAHQAPVAGCQIWPWHQAEKALRRTLHGVATPLHLP